MSIFLNFFSIFFKSIGGMADSWLWIGFILGIVILIFVDLLVLQRKPHEAKTGEALAITIFWILLSLGFNLWFGVHYGHTAGMEFLAGYLIEKSLSLDNIFVMYLIFDSLRIPSLYQHSVLFWGILGVIILRGTMIFLGVSLVNRFDWILYIFGIILIYSSYKFLRDEEEQLDSKEHWAIRWLSRIIPVSTRVDGRRFFVKESNVRKATPLLAALVLIEVSDLVFAMDSVPAVFSVTRDPFIAFASNILAVLGLRALYFVIAHWIKSLRYLKPGLAVLLGYVGLKMILVDFVHVPIWVSLLVISSILFTATVGSWYATRLETRKQKNM